MLLNREMETNSLESKNLQMTEQIQLNHKGIFQPAHPQTPSDMEHQYHDPSQLVSMPNTRGLQEQKLLLQREMESANFFQMSGIPKFGKNWLDNFIPDPEM